MSVWVVKEKQNIKEFLIKRKHAYLGSRAHTQTFYIYYSMGCLNLKWIRLNHII